MAANEGTLDDLEKEKQFLFNYKKRMCCPKLIRKGTKYQAIDGSVLAKRIHPYDPNLYEKYMTGKKEGKEEKRKEEKESKKKKGEREEEGKKIDFVYCSKGNILSRYGLSNFTDIKKMPLSLKKDPEKLWQLDERSLIPDEVEIFVPGGLPFKADIRPRGDLDTPFTKDNIIEMLSCLPWKKYAK